MNGLVSGMRFAEALASVPRGLDPEFTRELLLAGEIAFVAAAVRRASNDQEKE